MKACSSTKGGCFLVASLSILICGLAAFAQTSDRNTVPVVTIQATTPGASSPATPGVFTVFRSGNTNAALAVYYMIGGLASNGVDYARISGEVTIPAGAISGAIVITPLDNPPLPPLAYKTVALQLTPPPLARAERIPDEYQIGVPGNAVLEITAPPLGIYEPPNGAVFYTPTNIQITAIASGIGIFATNVEFFAGATDLGSGTPAGASPGGASTDYFLTWTNPWPGNYALTAVAKCGSPFISSVTITSQPVKITVLRGLPTHPPVVVRMISPPNGAVFHAPINLPLFAFFAYPHGPDERGPLGFYDGTNFLGLGQPVSTPIPLPLAPGAPIPVSVPPTALSTNIYELVWSNAPAGSHVLTAQGIVGNLLDPLTQRIVSAPVNITILSPLPPPTNRPPILSIVATDPVAFEGTNSWVWPGETNAPPTWAAWPDAVCRYFTNCGPKTAAFTVRRFGETNDDVTVGYFIGGTASNGVDYVALPGSVTIPPGQRSALITIVPIDDGPPDVNKTVILALAPFPGTVLPPPYLIGSPSTAAAVILDPTRACPDTAMLPDKCFHLHLPAPNAAWFYIQCSTDLVNWTSVCTNRVIDGSIDFVDPNAADYPAKFYRVVPLANAPQE
jgi:hypothetical protein